MGVYLVLSFDSRKLFSGILAPRQVAVVSLETMMKFALERTTLWVSKRMGKKEEGGNEVDLVGI